jgi:hypothetical protein
VVVGGGEIEPSVLPKQKRAPASLHVLLQSVTDNPSGIPDPVTRVVLNFDDDGTVTTRGLPVCRANLAGTTTEDARRRCRSSMLGTGRARAFAPGNVPTGAVITAFNGPRRNGNPTVLFHNRATELPITIVLQGVIRDSRAGADFGKAIDVPVEVPPGTILTRFDITMKKTWPVRGRRVSYISARCQDRNRILDVHAEIDIATGGEITTQTNDVRQTCKVKRKGKRR